MNQRVRAAEDQIREMLEKYGETFNEGTVWRVQGNPVISHKALERIAAKADIVFRQPVIVRAERDEAVILVTGAIGENEDFREEWSIGEALIDVNYRVSGRQAAYVWAMAEKRAKDRVILKLVNLHGLLYSEEEADEFKNGRPTAAPQSNTAFEGFPAMNDEAPPAEEPARKSSAALKRDNVWQNAMADLAHDLNDVRSTISLARLREEYRARAKAEGWNRPFMEQLKEVFDRAEEDLERQEEPA